MKNLLLGGLLSLLSFSALSQPQPNAIEAFGVGEYLRYRVHYGILDAGYAELRVPKKMELNGHEVFQVVGTGWSAGMFNWFFKVEDRYESFMTTEDRLPVFFKRRVNEGDYHLSRDITFDREKNLAYTDDQTFEVPENVHDLLSSFYYARTYDLSGIKPGDSFDIEVFLDHEVFKMRLKYLGKETIKSDLGKFDCLKFRPQVQVGSVFSDEEGLTLWVTDDDNHVPVRAQADVLVGSIRMDLIEARNTISPLNPK